MTKDELLQTLDKMFRENDNLPDESLVLDVAIEVIQQPVPGISDFDVHKAYKTVGPYHSQ